MTQIVSTIDAGKAIVIDEVDGSTSYYGFAKAGSFTSDPVWRIFKMTKSGTITQVTFADSNDNFDNVFDDRLSLTYG